jgi:hypothetical protein
MCEPSTSFVPPSFSSQSLTLELLDSSFANEAGSIPVPPFQFEVRDTNDLQTPVPMELVIIDPRGRVHTQQLSFVNMHEECDGYCDPAGRGDVCPPRRCDMRRFHPPAHRIDHTIYQRSIPGIWTFILHRLDNGERTSTTRRLFESEQIDDRRCEALPATIGGFRRVSCQIGQVPMMHYGGVKARYELGGCSIEAFALLLNQGALMDYDESAFPRAEARTFPEGFVHELRDGRVTARAWLAHYHLYVVGAHNGMHGFDELTRAMLDAFPVVDGPAPQIPSCAATGASTILVVPPITLDQVRADNASFSTHFEGNRPSGATAHFHDRHVLAQIGLRQGEIVHAIDGQPIVRRSELLHALERLAQPTEMELLVAQTRMREPRCIRLSVVAP